MFSNRRNIPYQLAVACPPLRHVERLVRVCGRLLPHGTPSIRPFWTYEVGIWLLHRDLWNECRGYDEDFIYFNWMETEMVGRLSQKYPIVNLGKIVDYDFYHLGHNRYARRRPGASKRKRNPVLDFKTLPRAFSANSKEWGLAKLPLQIVLAQTEIGSSGTRDGRSEPGVPSFLAWIVVAAWHAGWERLIFRLDGWNRSVQVAGSTTIKRRRLMTLPYAVATLWRKRFGRGTGSLPCD
jgi:hypothetical protein